MKYRYDNEKNIVYASAGAALELADLLCYQQLICDDNDIPDGFLEYIDLYQTKKCNIHFKDLDHFAPFWECYQKRKCKGTIVCAPYDITFATFRMIQLKSEQKTEDYSYNFFVFRTTGEVDELLRYIYKT